MRQDRDKAFRIPAFVLEFPRRTEDLKRGWNPGAATLTGRPGGSYERSGAAEVPIFDSWAIPSSAGEKISEQMLWNSCNFPRPLAF